jgi:RimJ/RimL family protein N-acetyltransferase
MTHVDLRPVAASDLPILFEQQLDPDAARMAAFPPRDYDAFLSHWRGILRDPSVMALAVTEGCEVLGYVASFDDEGLRLIGYWIGRQHWGRGIGRSAVSLFLERESTRPLHAHVARTNLASIRILERCDFRVVGTASAAAATGGVEVEELIFRLDE